MRSVPLARRLGRLRSQEHVVVLRGRRRGKVIVLRGRWRGRSRHGSMALGRRLARLRGRSRRNLRKKREVRERARRRFPRRIAIVGSARGRASATRSLAGRPGRGIPRRHPEGARTVAAGAAAREAKPRIAPRSPFRVARVAAATRSLAGATRRARWRDALARRRPQRDDGSSKNQNRHRARTPRFEVLDPARQRTVGDAMGSDVGAPLPSHGGGGGPGLRSATGSDFRACML